MSPTRLAASATFAAAAVLAASLLYGRITGATDPGAMDAMSIDMDTAGNTATSLGPWDECIIASPGDTLTIDVTATNIPASNPIIAFEYRLNYPAGVLTVESADPNFLLADLPGSSLFNLSDPVPDGDGLWYAGVADFTGPHENGSGVLDRMTLSVAPGAAPGVYSLALTYAYHGDDNNDYHASNTINNAFIAVNTTCENLPTPSPSPVPTPTPPPTLPPPPGPPAADVDCSGAVNSVDALKIVRFEVGLAVAQVEPCPDIGASSLGDVDCDSFTNPRDALAIVRYVAALPALSSQPGCPPIGGEPTSGEPYPVPEGGTPTPGPNGYTVSVTSAEVGAGGEVTVLLHLSAPQAGASAYSIDILYDSSLVTATSCENLQPIVAACNPAFAPNRVRVAAASPSGPNGEEDLVSITFRAGNVVGVSGLVPQVSMMLDPDGNPRSTTAISGSFTIIPTSPTPTPTATPMPSPTPTPGPVTPAPSPVPGAPPPFDPGGVICFENLESAAECDGDSSPGAAADIRTKFCLGWNADCSVRDNPVSDSNFGPLVSFTPPEWNLPRGDTIPVGAIAGRLDSEATLSLLNNPCNNRIQVAFTLLNASINAGDTISLRPDGESDVMQPLAMDANGNGIPDGADKYPTFVNEFLAGAQPRERLFGISNIQGAWVSVNFLSFEPGATLSIGGAAITFNPALGYPAVIILQDPTALAAPGAITDFCAPLFVHYVVLGKTINNPCSPTRVIGANCPVTSDVSPEIRELGYPSFPCDVRSRFDDDGDGKINDGCPQVNQVSETGAQCDNNISDDTEDSSINDGCPAFGDVSEGGRIPGTCSGGGEGGCTYRSNPATVATATFTTLDASQRDADGDGIENSLDVCALIPNPEWNPRAVDTVDDPDNDGLPSPCDPNPNQAGPGSPGGCRSGYTGADQDQDCFSNRADSCPNDTQLQDPGLPPEYNTNLPFAPDQDSDGIGDICDPDPAAPNGDVRALCLKFALNVGGAAGPVVGVVDSTPGPNCAAQPAGTPTPTPTPIPGPPIDIEASIDETGSVVPRDGVATIHGTLECDQPGLVELEVQVVQRAGRAHIVGVAEAAVWCYGHEEWRAEAVGNGRFVGGWVDVNVHAEAQAGLSSGVDDESARVRLSGGRGADR